MPRRGKRGMCTATDGYRQRADGATTMQMCFLACLVDARCNVRGLRAYRYMERPPEIECTLLGPVPSPLTACAEGTGTLIRRLDGGRPSAPPPVPLPTPGPSPPPQSPPPRQAYPGATLEALSEYRARVLRHVTYDISRVSSDIATHNSLPVLTQESIAEFPEWHAYIARLRRERRCSARSQPAELVLVAPIRRRSSCATGSIHTGGPVRHAVDRWSRCVDGVRSTLCAPPAFVRRPRWKDAEFWRTTRGHARRAARTARFR